MQTQFSNTGKTAQLSRSGPGFCFNKGQIQENKSVRLSFSTILKYFSQLAEFECTQGNPAGGQDLNPSAIIALIITFQTIKTCQHFIKQRHCQNGVVTGVVQMRQNLQQGSATTSQ